MTARTIPPLLLVVLASTACGGGDDIDCSYDESCGGDPTGDWDVAGACAAPTTTTFEECPEGTITQTTLVSGSWDFQADMTYSYSLQNTMVTTIRAPLECLNEQRGEELPPIATCEELNGNGVVCTTQAELCDCRVISDPQPTEQAGTWAATGSTLTLTDDFGSVLATYDFCREDDKTLKLVLSTFEAEPTILVLEK